MGGLKVHGEFGAVGSRFEVVGDHGRYREVDLKRTTLTLPFRGEATRSRSGEYPDWDWDPGPECDESRCGGSRGVDPCREK